jgi:hypothetical protein
MKPISITDLIFAATGRMLKVKQIPKNKKYVVVRVEYLSTRYLPRK